jgi:hypothetical protein
MRRRWFRYVLLIDGSPHAVPESEGRLFEVIGIRKIELKCRTARSPQELVKHDTVNRYHHQAGEGLE